MPVNPQKYAYITPSKFIVNHYKITTENKKFLKNFVKNSIFLQICIYLKR